MRTSTHNKLMKKLYPDGLPNWLVNATRESLLLNLAEGGAAFHTITLDDVCHHYAYDACNLTSGCRRLGSIVGDWRPVSKIANECLEIFKVLNMAGLRRAAKAYSHIMTPKF